MPHLNLNLWFGSGFLLYTKMSSTCFDHLALLVFPYTKLYIYTHTHMHACLGNKEIHTILLYLSTTLTVDSSRSFLLYVSTFSIMVVCKQLCILLYSDHKHFSISPNTQSHDTTAPALHRHMLYLTILLNAVANFALCGHLQRSSPAFWVRKPFPWNVLFYFHMV